MKKKKFVFVICVNDFPDHVLEEGTTKEQADVICSAMFKNINKDRRQCEPVQYVHNHEVEVKKP